MKNFGIALETGLNNLKNLKLDLNHNHLGKYKQNMEFLCKGMKKL